ncbi:hypothetical protein EVAR_63212_1 [Eumeta japonica]|uniref:Uncharacterized protein n=1 Tax=Eumeta variegata TaxID=151549 RepID=A0A4C1ZGW3_EUMVA|nr:hypothetical protein EVAR_63212_1 [Eumeta japonica]
MFSACWMVIEATPHESAPLHGPVHSPRLMASENGIGFVYCYSTQTSSALEACSGAGPEAPHRGPPAQQFVGLPDSYEAISFYSVALSSFGSVGQT